MRRRERPESRATVRAALWSGVLLFGVALALAVLLGSVRPVMYASWAALAAFVVYAARNIPRRHRAHGLGQIQQAMDNKAGKFGGHYPDEPVRPDEGPRVGRNQPCPCGSGLKFKRCCGTA